jgi:hypothetical protein
MAKKEGVRIAFIITIAFVYAMLILVIAMQKPSDNFLENNNITLMCIQKEINPCYTVNESCGKYQLNIFDWAVDCKQWVKDNNLPHMNATLCINDFQRVIGNCTQWVLRIGEWNDTSSGLHF